MVAGPEIALGRIHARQVVTLHLTGYTVTIDLDGDDTPMVLRTTTWAVRSTMAHQPREVGAAHVSEGSCKASAGTAS